MFIGVNYMPNHYPSGDSRNYDDAKKVPEEMKRLGDIGFTAVRTYQQPLQTLEAIIKAAAAGKMQVVYLVPLQADGTPLPGSLATLKQVVQNVTPQTFGQVVPLIFVGNEKLNENSVGNMVASIESVSQYLATQQLSKIPISSSEAADVMLGTDSSRDILVAAYTNGAPVAVNLYPFQWDPAVEQSVNDLATPHSIAWYVQQLQARYPGKTFLFSETGWATAGKGSVAGYANVNRVGSVSDAVKYYEQLYPYCQTNKIPLLAFEAYDEPAKGTADNPETHYGLLEQDGTAKSAGLLPT